MSLVTRLIKSPVCLLSWYDKDRRWMWRYNVLRKSCVSHWPTVVMDKLSTYELTASKTAMAMTDTAMKFKTASLSVPKIEATKAESHAGIALAPTMSTRIFSGHGCSKSARA